MAKSILIVEDEVLLADSIKAMLEHKGFSVEVAYDGEMGQQYAELGIYDLLTDIVLDNEEDLDFLNQLFVS